METQGGGGSCGGGCGGGGGDGDWHVPSGFRGCWFAFLTHVMPLQQCHGLLQKPPATLTVQDGGGDGGGGGEGGEGGEGGSQRNGQSP